MKSLLKICDKQRSLVNDNTLQIWFDKINSKICIIKLWWANH